MRLILLKLWVYLTDCRFRLSQVKWGKTHKQIFCDNVADFLPNDALSFQFTEIYLQWRYIENAWMKEEKEIEIHSHTHTKPTQAVSDACGPIMAITLSIHVRHKIYVCIPSGHYCCLRWCGELSLQWIVGLRACGAADSLCMCVNVCVCAWERGRVEWRSREKTQKSVALEKQKTWSCLLASFPGFFFIFRQGNCSLKEERKASVTVFSVIQHVITQSDGSLNGVHDPLGGLLHDHKRPHQRNNTNKWKNNPSPSCI